MLARVFKELGIIVTRHGDPKDATPSLPRISVTRPRAGFIHPLNRQEIRRILAFVGPTGTYGIKTVELRHQRGEDAGSICLARYHAPDSVVLFEQRKPPWILPGRLNEATASRLERAGAIIHRAEMTTVVNWPRDTLSLFMAFDGLSHEIGHHRIQQYEGKRNVRKRRTADHERRADAFAVACRKAWADETDR